MANPETFVNPAPAPPFAEAGVGGIGEHVQDVASRTGFRIAGACLAVMAFIAESPDLAAASPSINSSGVTCEVRIPPRRGSPARFIITSISEDSSRHGSILTKEGREELAGFDVPAAVRVRKRLVPGTSEIVPDANRTDAVITLEDFGGWRTCFKRKERGDGTQVHPKHDRGGAH